MKNKDFRNYFCGLIRDCILAEFLLIVDVDVPAESTDTILNNRGDELRFVISSRDRNA
jgi:hypothetical protein